MKEQHTSYQGRHGQLVRSYKADIPPESHYKTAHYSTVQNTTQQSRIFALYERTIDQFRKL